MAFGAEKGKQLELNIPEKEEGMASFGNIKSEGRVKKEKNQLKTLDGFVMSKKLNQIDIIKIDVEGFELFILEGAKETLKKFKPELLVEYSKTYQCGYSPIKIVKLMNKLGYSCYVLSKEDFFFYHKKGSNFKLGIKKSLVNFSKLSTLLLKHSKLSNYIRNLSRWVFQNAWFENFR